MSIHIYLLQGHTRGWIISLGYFASVCYWRSFRDLNLLVLDLIASYHPASFQGIIYMIRTTRYSTPKFHQSFSPILEEPFINITQDFQVSSHNSYLDTSIDADHISQLKDQLLFS
jgi:hypothetical protein